MGGSLGLAARERAGVAEVRGYSQTRATLDLALERGAITRACDSSAECVRRRRARLRLHACATRRGHAKEALARAPPHAVVTRRGQHQGTADALSHARTSRSAASADTLCAARRPPAWPTHAPRSTRARPTSSRQARTSTPTPTGVSVASSAQIGARPVAVDPDEHDRLMARHEPPAARAGQRAHDAGGTARGLARRPALGGPELPRPDAHRRQQPAGLDRHLPRQPRRAAGRPRHVPGGPAGGARGAGRQRRRAPRGRRSRGRPNSAQRMLAVDDLRPGDLYRLVVPIEDRHRRAPGDHGRARATPTSTSKT